jgi:hypothetical protein
VNPAAALEESERTSPGFHVSPRYRFGDLAVDLDSEDSEFVDRLSEIFGECAVERDNTRAAVLHCELRVLRESQAVLIRFGGQPEFDPVAFNLSLFSDGRYVEVPASLPGWRAIGPATDGAVFASFHNDVVVMDRTREWPAFTGHSQPRQLPPPLAFFRPCLANPGPSPFLLIRVVRDRIPSSSAPLSHELPLSHRPCAAAPAEQVLASISSEVALQLNWRRF